MSEAILLIHGFPLDGSMWVPQVTFLTAKGFHVLAPHLPGFGGTAPWGQERYSIDALAEEMHRLIQDQAGGRAVVAGFSMGGYIVQALVRAHPEAVRGVIFVDTRAEADSLEVRAGRLRSIDDVRAQGVAPLVETMLPRLLSKYATPELRSQVRGIMLRQSPAGVMGAQYAMAQRRDQSDLLPMIQVPTLLLVGAEDTITPPSVAMAMHNRIPDSMLVQVANAGHLANLEMPESVNNAIVSFMKTLPG